MLTFHFSILTFGATTTILTLFETTLRYINIGPWTKQSHPRFIRQRKLFHFNILFALHIKSAKNCRFTLALVKNSDVVAPVMHHG